jgi:hypothetical protein
LIERAAIGVVAALAVIVVGPPSPAVPQTSVHSVEVVGTTFRITLSDGHVLGQEELPGIRLMIGDGSGQQRTIRIDAVEHDPKDPAGEIVLYALSEQDPLRKV